MRGAASTDTTTTSSAAATDTNTRVDNNNSVEEPQQQLSISERYAQAVILTETSPASAVDILEGLQHDVARLSLFSTNNNNNNESLEDISTKSLPLLSLEHYLALAYTRLPSTPGKIHERQSYLRRSLDLWCNFMQKLDSLDHNNNSGSNDNNNNNSNGTVLISPAERKEYEMLVECSGSSSTSNGSTAGAGNDGTGGLASSLSSSSLVHHLPAPRREDKIARFRAKQQAQQEVARLVGLRERRSRMGITATEVMDDMDEDTLDRSVAMTNLLLNKAEALEEWASTVRELPMLERMVQIENERSQMERHKKTGGSTQNSRNRNSIGSSLDDDDDTRQRPPRPRAPDQGLQVTHITLDGNNQLQFRKEEIKSQVFRPGWNQPTMSLDQLADREVKDALEREARQKEAEANRRDLQQPRRYNQLLQDGLEDNADAVDASAAMDRAWDDWKDENPRGSGNKHGDRGDRNF